MIVSSELNSYKVLRQVVPFGYKYDEIKMKLEEEDEDEIKEFERLKKEQKKLKKRILDRKRSEKKPKANDRPH